MFYIIIDLYCYLVIWLFVPFVIIYLFYWSVLSVLYASIIYLLMDPYITSCIVFGL